MNKENVIEKLRNDEHYYGDFGKKYLSNSDIKALLTNPLALGKPSEPRPAFLVGGYFHTAILEPDKLKKYLVIPSSTRNTKVYKEMSGGELCLLQHEVDAIEKLTDIMLDNDVCKAMIRDSNTEYETPGIKEIEGEMWKGKADIINHNEKLVIDLKTTNDMVFIVIDKNTGQLGIFDCSPEFYAKGKDKVQRAVEAYRLFYKQDGFDPKQYFINKTL
jgi:hypothetical protein